MRKATDTVFRHLALLQLIPAYPKRVSVAQIQQRLLDRDPEFDVDIRSIQRDLDKLSGRFSLSCELEGRAKYWFWSDKDALTQIPAMNQSTALAFKLAAEHLKPIMPPSTLDLLAKYFQHADRMLRETKLGRWSEKTRIISRGPELIAPTVKPEVQEVVYTALLEDKQFEVDYVSKRQTNAKRQILNPLGIVFRNGIIYLVATSWDYQEPRHYALHRMGCAELSDKPANTMPNFDLARHIEENKEFSYPVSDKKIKLRALFSEQVALHLIESKLSEDQKVTHKKDGQMLIEATVADTAELRWWLLGFGSAVKVLAPSALRKKFSELTEEMSNLYKK